MRQDAEPNSQVRGAEDMTFSVTPHGVLAHIPIIASQNKVFADLFWTMGSGDCRFLLCLEEDRASQGRSSRRPSYSICSDRLLQINPAIYKAEGGYLIDAQPAAATWQDVLIRHRPPPRRLPGELPDTRSSFIPPMPMQLILDAPVRFDEGRIQQFMQESGLELDEVRNAEDPWRVGPGLTTVYVFTDPLMTMELVIKVGQCDWVLRRGVDPAAIWATVEVFTASGIAYRDQSYHDCLDDHVVAWRESRRCFSFSFQNHWGEVVTAWVELSFEPCPINPKRTLVMTASYQEVERYRPRPSSPSSHKPRRL